MIVNVFEGTCPRFSRGTQYHFHFDSAFPNDVVTEPYLPESYFYRTVFEIDGLQPDLSLKMENYFSNTMSSYQKQLDDSVDPKDKASGHFSFYTVVFVSAFALLGIILSVYRFVKKNTFYRRRVENRGTVSSPLLRVLSPASPVILEDFSRLNIFNTEQCQQIENEIFDNVLTTHRSLIERTIILFQNPTSRIHREFQTLTDDAKSNFEDENYALEYQDFLRIHKNEFEKITHVEQMRFGTDHRELTIIELFIDGEWVNSHLSGRSSALEFRGQMLMNDFNMFMASHPNSNLFEMLSSEYLPSRTSLERYADINYVLHAAVNVRFSQIEEDILDIENIKSQMKLSLLRRLVDYIEERIHVNLTNL